MFLGEHQHSLDAKGRVILPARFRDQLEGGAVMARALDGCLAVYPVAEFDRVARKLREARERGARERQAARTFFAGAVEITPDTMLSYVEAFVGGGGAAGVIGTEATVHTELAMEAATLFFDTLATTTGGRSRPSTPSTKT